MSGSPIVVWKSVILGNATTTRPRLSTDFTPPSRLERLGANRAGVNDPGASAALVVGFETAIFPEGAAETYAAFEKRRRSFAASLRDAVGRGNGYSSGGPLVWATNRDTDWATLDSNASPSASPVVLDLKRAVDFAVGQRIYIANQTTGQYQITTVSAVSGTDVTIPSLALTGTSLVTIVLKPEWILEDTYALSIPELTSAGSPLGGNEELEFEFLCPAGDFLEQP